MEGILVHEKKYITQNDSLVTVSFQLFSHDWNLLQMLPEWGKIEAWILGNQKRDNQKSH